MKIYRLLVIVLCVPSLIMGMQDQSNDIALKACQGAITEARRIIEDKEEIIEKMKKEYNQHYSSLISQQDYLSSENITKNLDKLVDLVNNEWSIQNTATNFLTSQGSYYLKIDKIIKNKMTTVSISPKDKLKLLTMDLFGCIDTSKNLFKGSSKNEIVALYDRLLGIRKSIIDACIKTNENDADLLKSFSISGRWYQIFYRPLNTLPAAPWNEAVGDENKVLLHCQAVRAAIANKSDDVKNLYRLYLLTMRELRIIVHDRLQGNIGGPLKMAGALGALVTIPLIKYFLGGKKSNKEPLPELKEPSSVHIEESSENNEE